MKRKLYERLESSEARRVHKTREFSCRNESWWWCPANKNIYSIYLTTRRDSKYKWTHQHFASPLFSTTEKSDIGVHKSLLFLLISTYVKLHGVSSCGRVNFVVKHWNSIMMTQQLKLVKRFLCLNADICVKQQTVFAQFIRVSLYVSSNILKIPFGPKNLNLPPATERFPRTLICKRHWKTNV